MAVEWFTIRWQLLVLRGFLGVGFGVVVMLWPESTAIAFVFVWGLWALVDGIGTLAQASQRDARGRPWLVAMGLGAVVVAFFAIFSPAVSAATITWILGVWLIARGALELLGALSSDAQVPRWVMVVGGSLSVLLGILFTANPGRAAVALAFWFGLTAVLWGLSYVALGLVLRRETTRV